MLEPRVEFLATVRRSRARNHSRGWRACPERNEGAAPLAARNPRNQANIDRAPAGAQRIGARRNRCICNFSVRGPSSRTKGIAGSAAPFSRRCRGGCRPGMWGTIAKVSDIRPLAAASSCLSLAACCLLLAVVWLETGNRKLETRCAACRLSLAAVAVVDHFCCPTGLP